MNNDKELCERLLGDLGILWSIRTEAAARIEALNARVEELEGLCGRLLRATEGAATTWFVTIATTAAQKRHQPSENSHDHQ